MLNNTMIVLMLTTTIIAATSAFHYKTKFDNLSTQSHINSKSTIHLVRELSELASDIRLVTHHTDCSEITMEIIGENCDLGSYMEWAGPELAKETQALQIAINNASLGY